jgi:hypothetical protein
MSTTIASANKRRKVGDKGLPLHQDIWLNSILPFVGMGHFAFVAGVNRQMKEYYKAYCDTLDSPPKVKRLDDGQPEPATKFDTFFRAVFSSVTCAEFWRCQAKKAYGRKRGYTRNKCTLIAKTGNLEVLKWAHEKKLPWNAETCERAASGGHLEMLIHATDNGCRWGKTTCEAAARNGHLDVLKYAHENCCPWDEDTCTMAAENGHLDGIEVCA